MAKGCTASLVKENEKPKPRAEQGERPSFFARKTHPQAAYNFNNDASQTRASPKPEARGHHHGGSERCIETSGGSVRAGETFAANYLGLSEVDGDFYSGVNVTDDAASKTRPQHYSLFRGGVADPCLVARLRSAQPRLSTRPAQVHQSAAFWRTHRKPACAHGCERKEAPKSK